MSDIPTARAGLSTAAVAGKIYAIGGTAHIGGTSVSTTEEYDPTTDTWTEKAPMPTARSLLTTCTLNGKIYAIGGTRFEHTAFSTVEEYDPVRDVWTTKADMPTRRWDICASVVNGRIYVAGGRGDDLRDLANVEEYDPVTDTWTRKADMPTARSNPSADVVNGRMYVIGGFQGTVGPNARIYPTVEEYDPATDSWRTRTPMATARAAFAASVLNGKIYVFSGTPFTTYLSSVEEYDPVTDTWTPKANVPTPRSNFGATAVAGRIYLIGGRTTGNIVTPTVEEYDTGFTLPSPDFDGNGIVEIADLLRLIEAWGQDEAAVDIAPGPFGDGLVDRTDLEVLMSHWGNEVDDSTLVACWKLDEVEGDVAYDSGTENDALVLGDAIWQPNGGKVGGALRFDGIDDYINAPFVLNPADAVFSVFAWVRGGAPGQVILSQADGANWLVLDTQGRLKTTLKSSRREKDLTSEAIVADGRWHRVGVTWDGANRTLYVDDIEVARDNHTGLQASMGELIIGTGTNLERNTFWSGLIDDVRIHARVLTP